MRAKGQLQGVAQRGVSNINYRVNNLNTFLGKEGWSIFNVAPDKDGNVSFELPESNNYGSMMLVIKDNKLVGGVMYGDTADGPWYFQLLKDGRDIHDIRDQLIFGQSLVGDVGHAGNSKAASMADSVEPGLKPYQPNHSNPAPSIVNGRLCGRIGVVVMTIWSDGAAMTSGEHRALPVEDGQDE